VEEDALPCAAVKRVRRQAQPVKLRRWRDRVVLRAPLRQAGDRVSGLCIPRHHNGGVILVPRVYSMRSSHCIVGATVVIHCIEGLGGTFSSMRIASHRAGCTTVAYQVRTSDDFSDASIVVG
jgi:hypothetical protein